MKKFFLLGSFALFGLVNAQTEKGSWVIGGSTNLGLNTTSTTVKANGQTWDSPKTTSFNFSPSIGYFVANNWAVGMDLGFTTATTKDGSDKLTNSTVSILPTATYYFKSDSKIIPYLGAKVGYASTTSKLTSNNYTDEVKVDGLSWGAKGGIMYMITPAFGADLGVAYNQFSNKDIENNVEVKTNVNTFGFNVGFSFFFK